MMKVTNQKRNKRTEVLGSRVKKLISARINVLNENKIPNTATGHQLPHYQVQRKVQYLKRPLNQVELIQT